MFEIVLWVKFLKQIPFFFLPKVREFSSEIERTIKEKIFSYDISRDDMSEKNVGTDIKNKNVDLFQPSTTWYNSYFPKITILFLG